MSILNIISLLGGLALFLFGMSTMSSGLEKLSGGRLEMLLERLTNNIFKGILLGTVVTGIIQSSSATTVMVVGFVNAGMMKLGQTVGVIFGANIGTTVTSMILSLGDIQSGNVLLQLLKPTSLAPIISVIGTALLFFSSNEKRRDLGLIFVGFGVLFFGMNTMEAAVVPLKDMPEFISMITMFSNPVVGVATGAILTAIIQSSSASVGILQALTSTGAIRFSAAAPIILGQNIGTCITAILSSLRANKNAKRAAMIHLYFNLIGTIVFLTIMYMVQTFIHLSFWDDIMTRGSIAIFHLFFNVFTTALLLPFNRLLVKLAMITIRDDAEQGAPEISVLDERFLASPSLALEKSRDVVVSMGHVAQSNFKRSAELETVGYDAKKIESIKHSEEILDKNEVKIDNYLIKLTDRELTGDESFLISELLHSVVDFERIGDHSVNIMQTLQGMHRADMTFSGAAKTELLTILAAVDDILDLAVQSYENYDIQKAMRIEPLEQVIDTLTEVMRARHIERLKRGECTVEIGMSFLELLISLERISDHCSNIGVYVVQQRRKGFNYETFDSHEYKRNLHRGWEADYTATYNEYKGKYLHNIR